MKLITIVILLFSFFFAHSQYGSKKKVFNSFINLNDEIEQTKQTVKRNNDRLYFMLMKSEMQSGDSASTFHADSLREKTNGLINYINSIKVLLLVKSEGLEKTEIIDHDTLISLEYVQSIDDYSTPTLLMIGDRWQPIDGQYSARELKNKLVAFEQELLASFDEDNQNTEIGIHVISEVGEQDSFNWEINNFYNVPLGGIITYLSKIQLDIRLSEAATLSFWLQN